MHYWVRQKCKVKAMYHQRHAFHPSAKLIFTLWHLVLLFLFILNLVLLYGIWCYLETFGYIFFFVTYFFQVCPSKHKWAKMKRSEKRKTKEKILTAQEMLTTTSLGLFFFFVMVMLVLWRSRVVWIKKKETKKKGWPGLETCLTRLKPFFCRCVVAYASRALFLSSLGP